MLDYMRKRASSLFIKFIFAIIIIVFVFWGIQIVTREEREVLATAGKKTLVTREEFLREYRRRLSALENIYKTPITPEMERIMGIKRGVLMDLIENKLLLMACYDLGIQATPDEIRGRIEGMKVFQRDGIFLPYLYKAVLKANGLSPEEFEAMIASDIMIQKLKDVLREIATTVDDGELFKIYKEEKEKIDLYFTRFGVDDYIKKVKLSEKELKSYYSENKEDFKTPLMVEGELAVFEKSRFLDLVKVNDREIEEYYNIHVDDYLIPEAVHVKRILVSSRKKAEEILKKLKKGESFEKLARRFSKDKKTRGKGGDMGFVERGSLGRKVESLIFSIKPGNFSGIIKTKDGFEIYKVVEKRKARYKKLEEVKGEVIEKLKKEKAPRILALEADKFYNKLLKEGRKPSELVKNKRIKVIPLKPFSENTVLPVIGNDRRFIEKCLSLNPGGFTNPYRTKNKDYAIFYCTRRIEPRIKDFEEVKNEVKRILSRKKAEDLAREEAEKFCKKVLKEGDIKKTASVFGVKVYNTGPFLRRVGFIPKIGWLKDKEVLFKISKEKPFLKNPVLIGDNFYVFQLKDIKEPTREEFEKDRDFRRILENSLFREALNSFVEDLKKKYEVKINWDLFRSL